MQVEPFDTSDPVAMDKFRKQAHAIWGAGADRMALQPGTTKQENGTTYVLNENHRWALPDQPGSEQNTSGVDKSGSSHRSHKPDIAGSNPAPARDLAGQTTLAAQAGDSPAHQRARKAVALHYLTNKAVYYDPVSKSTKPLDQPRIDGMMGGIDLSKPVVLGPPPSIPPPQALAQWQAEGGYRGSYFTDTETPPEKLGIAPVAVAWNLEGQPIKSRVQKVFSTKKAKIGKVSYLRSTAAPTVDTWSVPGEAQKVDGGGMQWFVPIAAHPNVRIPEVKKMSAEQQGSSIAKAIAETERLIAVAEDPPMVQILSQLKRLQVDDLFQSTIATIIMRNYDPAPTPEIGKWCDTVLESLP